MRLKEDDSSWRASGIKRRDFRHDPGMPETEVPRQTGLRRDKPKHEHRYEQRRLGESTAVRFYTDSSGERVRREYTVQTFIYVCIRCGNKKSRYYGGYWYW